MEVLAVRYSILGRDTVFYDRLFRSNDQWKKELKKVYPTAHITSVSKVTVTDEQFISKSFSRILMWNRQILEKRFDHIDKEAIQ